jgi:O-antigen/teichoic acid export membrane protein
MGVIQRQGFKHSIINLIGMVIGTASTIFIYPHALEVVGLFRSLFDASVLAFLIIQFGSPTSAVRFFPRYRDDATAHKGFLSWLLLAYAAGFVLFLLFFPFIHELMSKYLFHERNKIYEDFIIYVIPLTFCIGLINLLSKYISNFRRIVIPSALESLTIKIAFPIIIFMYLKGWLNVEGVVISIVVTYVLSTIGMGIYLSMLGQSRLTKPEILSNKSALKEYFIFSAYSFLGGVGSQVAFRIDTLMVTWLLQFRDTGIFAIGAALSEAIAKPMRAINTISGPMVAHYIETGNLEEVSTIYKKSSLNLTIIGLGMFLVTWNVLPYIFQIMPNTETMREGAYVVFFLGLAQVWDMMTGINNEIITYSRHYRFNLLLTVFLAVTNIIANLILIPQYGMTGAAMATCLSFFIFNAVKYVFIKIKYNFQPFSAKLIPVIAFGIAAWFIARWMPDTGSPWINVFYKGALFCMLYGTAILGFNISPDLNNWIKAGLYRIRGIFIPVKGGHN